MKKTQNKITVTDERIMSKIYYLRGQKVMLDADLALLYMVETKRLKEAVRRNIKRFPKDFMFEISPQEFESLRSQIASSKIIRGGTRYLPMAFTEQGVTMLSCVLNSDRAVAVNIKIIRIFTKMREMLSTRKDILRQVEKIERRLDGHDEKIQTIFEYLKQLLNTPEIPRNRIGFRRNNEKD